MIAKSIWRVGYLSTGNVPQRFAVEVESSDLGAIAAALLKGQEMLPREFPIFSLELVGRPDKTGRFWIQPEKGSPFWIPEIHL